MGTLADDEFPVSPYVDPAALEGPFYVGYVCLCFLSDAKRIHVRRQNRPADVTESCAQHHVKKRERERKREREKGKISWLARKRSPFARRI